MAAPSSVTSTTLQLLLNKLEDNSFISHPLIMAIEEKGNLKKVDGYQRVEQPVIFGEQSADIFQLSNGWETTNLNFSDPFYKATFEWCDMIKHVGINLVEKTSNKGPGAQVDILESKVKNAMIGLKTAFSQRIFMGPAATMPSALTLTNLQTLNGMTTAASTGWFEGVAAASQQNTVGGLAKSAANQWFNQFQDAGGTLTLDELDQLMINCQQYNPSGEYPDLLFLSPKAYGAFMKLNQSFVRYTTALGTPGQSGKMVPEWRGARVYMEPTLGFTAENPAKVVSGYALSSDQFSLYTDKDAWFKLGEPYYVPGSAVWAYDLHVRAQLTTGRINCHGVLLAAESA